MHRCIDWRISAESIYNLIRDGNPYVGAHFVHKGCTHTVWDATYEECAPPNIEPGKVLSTNDGYLIKVGFGAIRLLEISPPISLLVGDYL